MPYTEHTFDSGELTLHYARFGDAGPPLVLLHGVTRGWRDFLPLVSAFLPAWQIYALDFRGHGRSARSRGNYLVADYVRDAVAFVRDVVEGPAVVYGHSLGAMVAAAVAAELPDRVRAAILEDPPFDTMGERIRKTPLHGYFTGVQKLLATTSGIAELARGLAEIRMTNPASGESYRLGDVRDGASLRFSARCLVEMDPDVLSPIVAGRWLEGYDRDRVAAGIGCPVLLLQADEAAGGMLTDGDARHLVRQIADCTHVRLPGVGHLIHWTEIETTVRLACGFLGSLALR